jgi:hypothetical protein
MKSFCLTLVTCPRCNVLSLLSEKLSAPSVLVQSILEYLWKSYATEDIGDFERLNIEMHAIDKSLRLSFIFLRILNMNYANMNRVQ